MFTKSFYVLYYQTVNIIFDSFIHQMDYVNLVTLLRILSFTFYHIIVCLVVFASAPQTNRTRADWVCTRLNHRVHTSLNKRHRQANIIVCLNQVLFESTEQVLSLLTCHPSHGGPPSPLDSSQAAGTCWSRSHSQCVEVTSHTNQHLNCTRAEVCFWPPAVVAGGNSF